MRRSVSIALRIDDSGFLISCATSAANFSIASMRANSACAESDSAVASAPTSSRRCQQRRRHAARAAVALAHLGRGTGQAQDRPRDGQRQVPGQQHRQRQRQAEQRQDGNAHDEQAGLHLARLARQQDDADRVAVALHRLGHRHQQPVVLGAPDIGRHLAALAGAVEPQLLLHVRLPLQPARARRHVDHQRRRRLVRQQRQHLVVDPADRADDRPVLHRRRQRLGVDRAARSLAHAGIGDHRAVRRIQLGLRARRRLGQPAQQRPRDLRHQLRIVRARSCARRSRPARRRRCAPARAAPRPRLPAGRSGTGRDTAAPPPAAPAAAR